MNWFEEFRVKQGHKVNLAKIDPGTRGGLNKHSAVAETAKLCRKMQELQFKLYAEDKRSLLICLQAMDAGGKDGTIRHVVGPLNPQGTRVHCFKVPSAEEAEHDFLWRIHQKVPRRGEIAIFNRSHYEDVLVVRVHKLVPKKVWAGRYRLINEFEKNLVEGGTHILKFFLHISPEEQLDRFKDRLEDPTRQWKISLADYTERPLWSQYQKAYEEALSRTSTEHAPWFVIPANRKWFRNLAISSIITETMESWGISFPPPSVDLEDIRRRFHAEEEKG